MLASNLNFLTVETLPVLSYNSFIQSNYINCIFEHKHSKEGVMERTIRILVLVLIFVLALSVQSNYVLAKDEMPLDNIIDGELYPHGYTPMVIKNGS